MEASSASDLITKRWTRRADQERREDRGDGERRMVSRNRSFTREMHIRIHSHHLKSVCSASHNGNGNNDDIIIKLKVFELNVCVFPLFCFCDVCLRGERSARRNQKRKREKNARELKWCAARNAECGERDLPSDCSLLSSDHGKGTKAHRTKLSLNALGTQRTKAIFAGLHLHFPSNLRLISHSVGNVKRVAGAKMAREIVLGSRRAPHS